MAGLAGVRFDLPVMALLRNDRYMDIPILAKRDWLRTAVLLVRKCNSTNTCVISSVSVSAYMGIRVSRSVNALW
jgi:hypothetical protein